MTKNRKGISLIVLVITIIVMIILASAIILTLNNNGIIGKASKAVEETNDKLVQEIASLAYLEAYATGDKTVEKLEEKVIAALVANKIKPEDYIINVTESGVTVTNKNKTWKQVGDKLVKGNKTIEIGDVIDYDETAGGTISGLTDVTWKVLGLDSEGNIQIISSVIDGGTLGTYPGSALDYREKAIAEAEKIFTTRESKLNEICVPYGNGKNAIGTARAITMADIDKLTGYDPTTYNVGQINQYNNVVTFYYDGDGDSKPTYKSDVVNGELTDAHADGFLYYNGEKFVLVEDIKNGTPGEAFAKVKSTYYAYSISDMELSDKIKTLLYEESYRIATSMVNVEIHYIRYESAYMSTSGYIYSKAIIDSDFTVFSVDSLKARAIVTLSSDIDLKWDDTKGWTY